MSKSIKLILLTHMCMASGGAVGSEYEAINQDEADSMIAAGFAKLASPNEAPPIDVATIENEARSAAAKLITAAEDEAKTIIEKAEAEAAYMIAKTSKANTPTADTKPAEIKTKTKAK